MNLARKAEIRPVHMGDLSAELVAGPGGVMYVRNKRHLDPYPRSIIDHLRRWAGEAPDRVFLADRVDGGAWRKVTFAQALEKARAIAQYMLDRELSAERPVAILSGNGIEHGLIAVGAMMAGVPFSAVSPAYSLISKDHSKLKHVFGLITPGLVFAADGQAFANALGSVMKPGIDLVVARNPEPGRDCALFDDMLATEPTGAVEAADAAVNEDTVAKFLFTSGSTGMPKAVINTQRMLCCNQVMISDSLAFLKDAPPVLVDWLPWNHTAGGNHNFGIALANGGTLYVDDGTPTPAGIEKTVRNLTEIAPTLYFNVPKGYEMLADHLGRNAALRRSFFSRLELLQYAGAGLSQHVWNALERLAVEETGRRVMIITGYGSTETAPFACTTTWPVNRPGEIGLPAPDLELKLVPADDKLEVRLRGPNITPGYWRQPDKSAESFDEEGFYRIGDALKFVDPDDIDKGLIFDGRVSEDFKLSTGTWVNTAAVRGAIVRVFAPYVRDAVLTGLNRNFIGALLITDHDAVRRIAPELERASEAEVAHHPAVRELFRERLDALAAESTGSSNFVRRINILDTPPSIDLHEVTDKGSINQRAVLSARAHLVEDIYADEVPSHILSVRR